MKQQNNSLLVTGIIVIVVGLNVVLIGSHQSRTALEVIGGIVEVIGVILLGVVIGNQNKE